MSDPTERAADEIVADFVSERDLLVECQGELKVVQEQLEHLQVALVSARRIGAAIGILMNAHKLTDDQAFQLLVQASQDSNRKLRDIADVVLRTGALEPGRT